MPYVFAVIAWIAIGLGYIAWAIKRWGYMPPKVWWEYPIVFMFYVLLTGIIIVHEVVCAIVYCLTFGHIDWGN